jgi:hypothetical protein
VDAAIHLQVSLALQAVSSVKLLQTLLVLAGFFAGSVVCAYAATPSTSTAAAADAPNSLPMAVTLLSPNAMTSKDP